MRCIVLNDLTGTEHVTITLRNRSHHSARWVADAAYTPYPSGIWLMLRMDFLTLGYMGDSPVGALTFAFQSKYSNEGRLRQIARHYNAFGYHILSREIIHLQRQVTTHSNIRQGRAVLSLSLYNIVPPKRSSAII